MSTSMPYGWCRLLSMMTFLAEPSKSDFSMVTSGWRMFVQYKTLRKKYYALVKQLLRISKKNQQIILRFEKDWTSKNYIYSWQNIKKWDLVEIFPVKKHQILSRVICEKFFFQWNIRVFNSVQFHLYEYENQRCQQQGFFTVFKYVGDKIRDFVEFQIFLGILGVFWNFKLFFWGF